MRLVWALLALTSCRGRTAAPVATSDAGPVAIVDAAPAPPPLPPPPLPPPADADSGLAPLTDHVWLEQMDLENGDAAFVSVPLGATEPRPIMVAGHGAGDRPEWACGAWRGVTGSWPFIVCPRGPPYAPDPHGGRNWPSAKILIRVIDEALPAVRARYGKYVADGPMLYAGFSRGAILGAAVVRDRGGDFPLAVFSEGGYDALGDPSFGAAFAKSGGKRVLLGCSHFGCPKEFAPAKASLARAGVGVRINDAGNIGHALNEEITRSLQRDWPWLVEGDPRWRP